MLPLRLPTTYLREAPDELRAKRHALPFSFLCFKRTTKDGRQNTSDFQFWYIGLRQSKAQKNGKDGEGREKEARNERNRRRSYELKEWGGKKERERKPQGSLQGTDILFKRKTNFKMCINFAFLIALFVSYESSIISRFCWKNIL